MESLSTTPGCILVITEKWPQTQGCFNRKISTGAVNFEGGRKTQFHHVM